MNLPHDLSALCMWLVITLGHFLWQGAAIALLAALAGAMLRRSVPAVRYRVFLVALAIMAACPVATLLLTHMPAANDTAAGSGVETTTVTIVTPPAPPVAIAPSPPDETGLAPRPASANAIPPAPVAATAAPSATELQPFAEGLWQRLSPYAAGAYLLGVLAMFARLLAGLGGGLRLRRASEPITDPALLTMLARQARALGLRMTPAVACCGRVAVPVVVGVIRPMILLPLSMAAGLSPDQVEAILAHELAHIRRLDPLVNVIQRLIESLLFYHPGVWYISRRIRIERENCCDDLAVAAGAQPCAYAESLLHIARRSLAESRARRARPAVGLGATGKPSLLRARIGRLIGGPEEPVRVGRTWPVALLLIAAVLAGTAMLNLRAESPSDDPSGANARASEAKSVELTEAQRNEQWEWIHFGRRADSNSPSVQMTGNVAFGKMVPVLLAAGAGKEPAILRLAFVTFEESDDGITAKLYGQLLSYPKGKWRVGMELAPKSSEAVSREVVIENSAIIVGIPSIELGHLVFRFAAPQGDLAKARFTVKLSPADSEDKATAMLAGPDYEAMVNSCGYRELSGSGAISVEVPEMPRKLPAMTRLWREITKKPGTELALLLSPHVRPVYWEIDGKTFAATNSYGGSAPPRREFNLPDFPGGIYRLSMASRQVDGFLAGATGTMRLTGEKARATGRLEWFKGASLTIRLHDPKTGRACANVPVLLRLANGLPLALRADEQGLLKLEHLPPGPVTAEIGVRDWWSLHQPKSVKTVRLDAKAGDDKTVAIEYTLDRPTYQCAATRPAGDWGPSDNGVQARLRAVKRVCREGETPQFLLDVRNQGELPLSLYPSLTESFRIEVDGQWYDTSWSTPWMTKALDFGPGAYHKDISFSPVPIKAPCAWKTRNGQELIFSPGKHMIRVSIGAPSSLPVPDDKPDQHGQSATLVTKEVEIEILPVQKGGSTTAPSGDLDAAKALWICMAPHERTVKSLAQLSVLAAARNLNQDVATAGEWEIRSADNARRIARLPYNWPVRKEQFLPDGKGIKGGKERTGRFELNAEQRQRIGKLPDGEYLLAWLVRGQRRSNIMRLTVDSKYDRARQLHLPLLELSQIPPGPGRVLPMLVLRARRHAKDDPSPLSSHVAFATLNVDGMDRAVSAMLWCGPDGPLAVGKTYARLIDPATRDWDPQLKKKLPPLDPKESHVIFARVGPIQSSAILTANDRLPGRAWDAATAKLPAIAELAKAVSLSGSVVNLAGKVGGGYEVWLSSGERTVYLTKADEEGRYEFFRIPPGTYKLNCNPPKMGQPALAISGVVVRAGKRTERDISLESRFVLAGRVLDADGKPIVNMTVDLSSREAGAEFMNTTQTDAKGRYRHASPLGTIGYVGVNGHRILGKMPVVTPGVNHVDFVAEGRRYRAQ